MADTSPPSTLALVLMVPSSAGMFGLMVAALFYWLRRLGKTRAIWAWPPALFLLVVGVVASGRDIYENSTTTLSTFLAAAAFALLLGVGPTFAVARLYSHTPAPTFGQVYGRTALAIMAGMTVIAGFIYLAFRLSTVA